MKRAGFSLSICTIIWMTFAVLPQSALAYAPCADLATAQTSFETMARLHTEQPSLISNGELRTAALNYLFQAEACYHSDHVTALPGNTITSTVTIDDGPKIPPDHPSPEVGLLFNTQYGVKWGNGSPFSGGQDVIAPGLAGGIVTYSYMPANVTHFSGDTNPVQPNRPLSQLNGYSSCFLNEINNAFAVWSAVANIQFVQVDEAGRTNSGAMPTSGSVIGNIRLGAHLIDGPGGHLAHAYYPPYYGAESTSSLGGDIHFDTAETWGCTPQQGLDIGIIAIHEIGHSLGLSHQASDRLAIMNPTYNPSRAAGLQTDDITGAQALYGPALTSGLIISQATEPRLPLPGQPLVYHISLENPGPASVTNVIVTSQIPEQTAYVANSADGGSSLSQSQISWQHAQVESGQSLSHTFTVMPFDAALPGTAINSLATVTPGHLPGGSYLLAQTLGAASCGFSDDFEAGSQLGSFWTTSHTSGGRVRVAANSDYAYSGQRSIWLDSADGTNSHAAIILHTDLTNRKLATFDFWWRNDGDEIHAADGVFLSDDNGATWHKAYDFNRDFLGSYHHTTLDLDAKAAKLGLAFNHKFKIKLQFYDNWVFNGDGYAIDDVALNCEVKQPSLSLSKQVTVARTPVQRGDTVTYTLVLANSGDGPATAVQLIDTLPAYLEGSSLFKSVTVVAQQQLTFTLPVTLAHNAPSQQVITNTASFSHPSGSGQASAAFTTALYIAAPTNTARQIYLPIINQR